MSAAKFARDAVAAARNLTTEQLHAVLDYCYQRGPLLEPEDAACGTAAAAELDRRRALVAERFGGTR